MKKLKTEWAGHEEALAVAEVLQAVRMFGIDADEVHVDSYRNGREAGYEFEAITYVGNCGSSYWLKAVVCNLRNTDGIVVYLGTKDEFDEPDCPGCGRNAIPNEKVYRAGKRFSYRGTVSAAKLIVKHLSRYTNLRKG